MGWNIGINAWNYIENDDTRNQKCFRMKQQCNKMGSFL